MYLSPCFPLSLFVSFNPWLCSPCYTGVYFSILLADDFCFVVSLLACRLFCTLTALVASQLEFCSVTCLPLCALCLGPLLQNLDRLNLQFSHIPRLRQLSHHWFWILQLKIFGSVMFTAQSGEKLVPALRLFPCCCARLRGEGCPCGPGWWVLCCDKHSSRENNFKLSNNITVTI